MIALTLFPPPSEARKKKDKLAEQIVEMVDEKFMPPPKSNEVCFSPENHCDIKLLKFIQSAEKSIDIAIYDINLDQIVHAVLVKAKTIPVRILVDQKQAKTRNSLVSTLKAAGANLKFGRQRGIMHNKFTLIDGKRLETGSFNYTHGGAFMNNENQIYLDTPEIVEAYKARFEKIWNAGAEVK